MIEEEIDIIMIEIDIDIEINIEMMIIIQVDIGQEKLDLKNQMSVIIVVNMDIGQMNVICLKKISKFYIYFIIKFNILIYLEIIIIMIREADIIPIKSHIHPQVPQTLNLKTKII